MVFPLEALKEAEEAFKEAAAAEALKKAAAAEELKEELKEA